VVILIRYTCGVVLLFRSLWLLHRLLDEGGLEAVGRLRVELLIELFYIRSADLASWAHRGSSWDL